MVTYSRKWYQRIREGCQRSAGVVAPIVYAKLQPARVVDVGCGEGWWALAFSVLGADVLGIDGEYVEGGPLGDRRIAHDLTQPFPELGAFDLAVCLEVAEHLDEQHADHLVGALCDLAPTVLFSAAIPRQGGVGHVNCQWPRYWAALFAKRGYRVSGALRWQVWEDADVESWYRQNLLVATRTPELVPDWFGHPSDEPLALHHPELHLS